MTPLRESLERLATELSAANTGRRSEQWRRGWRAAVGEIRAASRELAHEEKDVLSPHESQPPERIRGCTEAEWVDLLVDGYLAHAQPGSKDDVRALIAAAFSRPAPAQEQGEVTHTRDTHHEYKADAWLACQVCGEARTYWRHGTPLPAGPKEE